jgi:hypothetical protein
MVWRLLHDAGKAYSCSTRCSHGAAEVEAPDYQEDDDDNDDLMMTNVYTWGNEKIGNVVRAWKGGGCWQEIF